MLLLCEVLYCSVKLYSNGFVCVQLARGVYTADMQQGLESIRVQHETSALPQLTNHAQAVSAHYAVVAQSRVRTPIFHFPTKRANVRFPGVADDACV